MAALLLERDGEVNALGAALDDACAGAGRLLVVEAPAGRGKSALLTALGARAQAAGMRVVTGRGGEYERSFAFGTIRQLFERLLASASAAERARWLAGAAALATSIVSGDGFALAEPGYGGLHAIYWLATNLSVQQPLMLAVDDLHWADEASLQALDYLARRIGDLPVALVVTLRPAEPGVSHGLLDAIRTAPEALTTRLAPLSASAVSWLVTRAIPEADPDVCAACFEMSAGNPFYLQELLASLEGDVSAERVRLATVPDLGDRVVRRIERLGPRALTLAQAMAVLGDGGSLGAAATVGTVDHADAAAAAGQMRRVEILAAEDPFAFAHPLVRRSVYEAMTVAERDRAHGAAARVLREAGATPGVVATHLSLLRPAGSDEVVSGLRAAAQDALSRGAADAAAQALRRSLDEAATDPPRAVLLRELGEIEVVARDLGAVAHLSEALELSEDPVQRARVAIALTAILGAMGRWDELLAMISAALRDLGPEEVELRLDLEAYRAIALANDGERCGEYDRDEQRLLELAQGETWPARALCALVASIWASRGERIAEVRPLIERGIRDGVLLRERGTSAWPIPQALAGLVIVDETDRASEVIEDVAAVARRDGSAVGALTAAGFRAWVHVRRGDLAAAEAEMQTVLDIAHPNDMQMEVASLYWFLADVLGERAGLDAIAAGAEAIEPGPEFARTMAGAMMHEVRGRSRLARRDRAGAVGELRAAAGTYTRLRVGPSRSPWRSVLALVLPVDARDESLALVAEEVALAERARLARPLAVALRSAAAIAGGDDEVDRLRRSVALLEGTDARLELARSLVALGSALRRRAQKVEARGPLATALDLAERCGAVATAAQAADELKAAGARPRHRARSGIDALTVSEARVARLVAAGRSNADVAQELFVSLKTVETHLTHIYVKLGLSGSGARRRLASALTDASAQRVGLVVPVTPR